MEEELDDGLPSIEEVPMLIALLRSRFEEERDDALSTLAQMVNGAFGEDGAQLGHAMRTHGGVQLLANQLFLVRLLLLVGLDLRTVIGLGAMELVCRPRLPAACLAPEFPEPLGLGGQ